MSRVVISTVGTSLLTKQIRKGENWSDLLRNTANLGSKEIDQDHPELVEVITELQNRAESWLRQKNEKNEIKSIRQASAELNGICGLYQEDIAAARGDMHWLIATDTYQGIITAKILKNFLLDQKLSVDIHVAKELSTASTEKFSNGIDDLITWLDSEVKSNYSQQKVCFNLVGGFKSLQGYLNTIGMFYADEIIYIFEGEQSELITIPRLPIKIDYDSLKPYQIPLALMAAGAIVSMSEIPRIPESMIYPPGEAEVMLSSWGKLIWNECKRKLLSQELLSFPYLEYSQDFVTDYNKIGNPDERMRLQEDLAKVSNLLTKSGGNTKDLYEPLNYTRYKGSDGIDHFRINLSMRVSCKLENGKLILRHYGTHDHVERSEKLR